MCPLKVFSSVLRDRLEKKPYKIFALVFEVCAVSWEQGGSGSMVALLDFREEQLNSGVWGYLNSTPARLLFLGAATTVFTVF